MLRSGDAAHHVNSSSSSSGGNDTGSTAVVTRSTPSSLHHRRALTESRDLLFSLKLTNTSLQDRSKYNNNKVLELVFFHAVDIVQPENVCQQCVVTCNVCMRRDGAIDHV